MFLNEKLKNLRILCSNGAGLCKSSPRTSTPLLLNRFINSVGKGIIWLCIRSSFARFSKLPIDYGKEVSRFIKRLSS